MDETGAEAVVPQRTTPVRPEGGQFRATNSAQLERRRDADAGVVLVESTFNNTDGGRVATYTGAGRAIQKEEWIFGPNGRLERVNVIDAMVKKEYQGAVNAKKAKDILTQYPEYTTVARQIQLQRNPDGKAFTVVEGSEAFDGNTMEEWQTERAAHTDAFTANRPEPVATIAPQASTG